MYPAMARTFRSVGAQFAAMFAYDMLRTASRNLGWQTHYLNLVYTPRKAMSAIIAAEAMRRLPRMQVVRALSAEHPFGDFPVSAEATWASWWRRTPSSMPARPGPRRPIRAASPDRRVTARRARWGTRGRGSTSSTRSVRGLATGGLPRRRAGPGSVRGAQPGQGRDPGDHPFLAHDHRSARPGRRVLREAGGRGRPRPRNGSGRHHSGPALVSISSLMPGPSPVRCPRTLAGSGSMSSTRRPTSPWLPRWSR